MTAGHQRSPKSAKSMPISRLKDIRLTCVQRTGWLKKQGGLVKSWQSRWFVLSGAYLYYYGGADDATAGKSPAGRLPLTAGALTLPVTTSQDTDKYFFDVLAGNDCNDVFLLAASNEEERYNWVRDIRKVIYYDRGGAVFGQPLEQTMRYEHNKGEALVPRVVSECISYVIQYGLDVEGVFRLPGRSTLVRRLHCEFDSATPSPILTPGDVDVHSAASLMKLYLRELPEPLVPYSHYESIVKICNRDWYVDGRDPALKKLAAIIRRLPVDRYELTRAVSCFLSEVSEHSDYNKMTASNLATIFAHSFLRPEADDDPALLMGTASNRTHCVFLLIEEWQEVFSLSQTMDSDDGLDDDEPQICGVSRSLLRPSQGHRITEAMSHDDLTESLTKIAVDDDFNKPRPLSELELMNRYEDDTGKSILSLTRSKTIASVPPGSKPQRLRIIPNDLLLRERISDVVSTSTPGGDNASTAATPGGECANTAATPGGECASTAATPGGECASTAATPGGECASTAATPGGECASTTATPGGDCVNTAATPGGECASTAATPGSDCASTAATPSGDCANTVVGVSDEDSSDELFDVDAESLNRDELVLHSRRLAAALNDQRLAVRELRAQLYRQGKRDARLLEKLDRKLTDEAMATNSAIRRLASVQSRLNEYENKPMP